MVPAIRRERMHETLCILDQRATPSTSSASCERFDLNDIPVRAISHHRRIELSLTLHAYRMFESIIDERARRGNEPLGKRDKRYKRSFPQ